MRFYAVPCLLLAFVSATLAQTTIMPTTTLTAETANNTSTADTFTAQSNGNVGAGNVSKVDTHSFLYTQSTTKIYAHFMGWFGQSNHMDVGYTSSDPSQVQKQVADALSRGISGFILDWYGPNNSMPNNTAFALKSEAESRNGAFLFSVMMDGGALGVCASTAGCDLTQEMINDLNYAYTNFEGSPAYMTLDGRPIVTFFDPDRYGTLDWATISANVSGNPLFIFRNSGGFTHASTSGSFSWVIINTTNANDWGQSYLDNFYSTALSYPSEHAFAANYKGFNDTLASWGSKRIMNQNCGQTWLNTFSEIPKYYSGTQQLKSVQLVTWNDYEEGTELESGIDNCVSVSGSMNGTVLNWTTSGSEGTLDHYTVFISPDGEGLMSLGDFAPSTHSLDLASYNFAVGSYTLYIRAVGRPSFANHMSSAISYGNSAPAPDFTLTATPSSQNVPRSSTTTYTVLETALNGFSGSVALSVAGVPGGGSATFSPATIGANQSSTLSVTVGNGRGKYTLTITGTSGTLSHSTNVVLNVTK